MILTGIVYRDGVEIIYCIIDGEYRESSDRQVIQNFIYGKKHPKAMAAASTD